MTWVKVSDGFPGHVKVRGLSDAAFRLHVTALCDCAAHLTDGRVTSAAARTLPGSPHGARLKRTVAELVAAGLWDEDPEDGWLIHDFLEWNPSGECVRANRVAARERMNRVRSPSVRANTQRTNGEQETNKRRTGDEQTENESRSSCDRATRVPSRPVPSIEQQPPPPLQDLTTCGGGGGGGGRVRCPRTLSLTTGQVAQAEQQGISTEAVAALTAKFRGSWCDREGELRTLDQWRAGLNTAVHRDGRDETLRLRRAAKRGRDDERELPPELVG